MNSRTLVLTKFRGDIRVSCTKHCMSSNGESLLYTNLTFIWEIFLKRRALIFRNGNQNPHCNKPLRRNSNSVSCQAPNKKRTKLLGNVVFSLTSTCVAVSTSVKMTRKYCLRFFFMYLKFRTKKGYFAVLIKIQPDATVCTYLFTLKSLYMFRVSQHPSSGVLKTVTAASITGTATFLQRGPIGPRWRKVAVPVL